MQSRASQLTIASEDARARRAPVAMLAHNLAISGLLVACSAASSRVPTASSTASSSNDEEKRAMRLRVLWRIARHHFDSVSLPTRTLLTLAAPPSLQHQHVLLALAGAGGLVTETQSDLGTLNADLLEVRASRALAAALLLDPLYLLVDLAVAHGQAATAPALALSLSLCVGQALVASAALHQKTAEGWRQALLALSDELAAEMEASNRSTDELAAEMEAPHRGTTSLTCAHAEAEPSEQITRSLGLLAPLLVRHGQPLLEAAAHMLCVLAPLSAAAGSNAGSTVGSTVGSTASTPTSFDCAVVCQRLAAVGVSLGTLATALRCVVPRMLRTCAALHAPLWESGLPAFTIASLSAPPVAAPPLAAAPRLTERTRIPPARLGLLPLPHSFEELFHAGMGLHCELCGATPSSRALCLCCGACLCGLETLHGPRACISHAGVCGEGSAVFLLTNTSAVVLVRDKRFQPLGSPYRDAHGETDVGLMRGKPLTLDRDEYENLSRQWLTLGFPRVESAGDH
jgi:hypothetical protein